MEKDNQIINSNYNGFAVGNGNLIWAGALSLAWHELVQNIIKQPIKINSKQQVANKIVTNFNKCPFTRKDIDDRCIYVKSGYGQQTVKTINTQCKKKFPQKSFGDLQVQLGPQDIISYAYLLKKLQFKQKFAINQNKNFLFQGQKVESFYAKQKAQKKQIKWYVYKNRDQFMISIDAKNPNDQIFFIKNKNITSFDEAMNLVKSKQKNGAVLQNQDLFEMPMVQLDVKRNVQQLQGQVVANKNFSDYKFGIVYEAIKLKIDEAGAKVQNQGVIVMLKCCVAPKKEIPKQFILDKEFWVIMKQKGKHPYLCALIKNPQSK